MATDFCLGLENAQSPAGSSLGRRCPGRTFFQRSHMLFVLQALASVQRAPWASCRCEGRRKNILFRSPLSLLSANLAWSCELARVGVQFCCTSSKALVIARGKGWGETPVSCLVAHPSRAVATAVWLLYLACHQKAPCSLGAGARLPSLLHFVTSLGEGPFHPPPSAAQGSFRSR